MRSSFIAVVTAIAGAYTGGAHAACAFAVAGVDTQGQQIINAQIGNTNDATLLTAFRGNNCTVTKTAHGGGRSCGGRSNVKNHYTVQIGGGRTCHVFPDVIVNSKTCTTCQ